MMDKQQIEHLLSANKKRLQTKYHLKTIALFGSITHDDFTESSDVDILIEYDIPMGVEFIDLAEELETLLSCKVDLVSKNGIKPKYFQEIQKDLIYV